MSESLNVLMPMSDLAVAPADKAASGSQPGTARDADFAHLMDGMVQPPSGGVHNSEIEKVSPLASLHALKTDAVPDPADGVAPQGRDNTLAATSDGGGRKITELEFLFQRHAGKPHTGASRPDAPGVAPAPLAVAASDNPRLTQLLARLLPDSAVQSATGSPGALAARSPQAGLPDAMVFAPLAPLTDSARKLGPGAAQTTEGKDPAPPASGRSHVDADGPAASARQSAMHHRSDPAANRQSTADPARSEPERMAAVAAQPVRPADLKLTPTRRETGPVSSPRAAAAGISALPGALPGSHVGLATPTASATATTPLPLTTATTQVTEQLVWMAQTGQNSAQVRLHPEELGMVNIRITMEAGSARIAIEASHPDLVQELTGSAPRLRQLLASEGLGLNTLEIDHRQSGPGGERSRQENGQENAGDRQFAQRSGSDPRHADGLLDEPMIAPALLPGNAAIRLLDLFA